MNMACPSRSTSMNANEKELLLSLVKDYSESINDRSYGFKSIQRKKMAWDKITKQVNAAGYGPERTEKQLRRIWEKIKARVKKEHAQSKRSKRMTGGGDPPKEEGPEMSIVLDIFSNDLNDTGCDFDSDSLLDVDDPVELAPPPEMNKDSGQLENTSHCDVLKNVSSQVLYAEPATSQNSTEQQLFCDSQPGSSQKSFSDHTRTKNPRHSNLLDTPKCRSRAKSKFVEEKENFYKKSADTLNLQREVQQQMKEAASEICAAAKEWGRAAVAIAEAAGSIKLLCNNLYIQKDSLKKHTLIHSSKWDKKNSSFDRVEEFSPTSEKIKNTKSDSHLTEESESAHENNHPETLQVKEEEIDYIVKEEHDISSEENNDLDNGEISVKRDVDLNKMSCDVKEENIRDELNDIVKK